MFEPTRGGTRGGQAEFKWTDVSADKDREHYLGHSINAPTGRWQKNKDVHWYSRDQDLAESERLEEIRKVKEAEAEALAAVLGYEPTKPKTDTDGPATSANQIPLAINPERAAAAAAQEKAAKEERRRKKAERKEEKAERKEEKRRRKEEKKLSRHHHHRDRRDDSEDEEYERRRHRLPSPRSRSPVRRRSASPPRRRNPDSDNKGLLDRRRDDGSPERYARHSSSYRERERDRDREQRPPPTASRW